MFSRRPVNSDFFMAGYVLLALLITSTTSAELVYTDSPGKTISGAMLVPAAKGEIRDSNLFHSFDTFNVQVGESATFTGPDLIANIIARVTGSGGTLIDGLLKSEISQANLFLINPNGIVIGKQASLDVDGDLYFSTANSLGFADGSTLFMSASGNSVLTSAAPAAFGFLSAEVAPISLEGAVLSNHEGSAVSLVGGDITLHNASIYIPDGHIDMVAVRDIVSIPVFIEQRQAELYGNLGKVQVINEGVGEFDKILLMIQRYGKRVADLDVTGESGGRIDLLADTFTMSRGFMFADTELAGEGQGISIFTDTLSSLTGGSRITTDSLGDGHAGDIQLTSGGQLQLSESATIASDARGNTGNGGAIVIAVEDLRVQSLAQIKTTSNSQGDGGEIRIDAATVSLLSGGAIAGQTIGSGRGGNITITATDTMLFDGIDLARGVNAGVSVSTLGEGKGGTIYLATPSLTLSNGAAIKAFSGGQQEVSGAAGSITINADELQIDHQSQIDASSFSTSTAGAIKINGDALHISGSGSGIFSETIGSGAGGSVLLAIDQVTLADGASLEVTSSGSGDAGQVAIESNELTLTNGSNLTAQALSSGKGGDVSVTATDHIQITGSATDEPDAVTGITVSTQGAGDAGSITLASPTIDLNNGASVQALSGGQNEVAGAAGQITITAGQLGLYNGAQVDVSSNSTADAGTVTIESTDVLLTGDSIISSATLGTGQGGSVKISGASLTATERSRITASSVGSGDAGQIDVRVDAIDLQSEGAITSETAADGNGGSISISGTSFTARDGSGLAVSSAGAGDAGNIAITVESLSLASGSAIAGQTLASGQGGSITVQAARDITMTGSQLTADDTRISVNTAGSGHAGDIQITTPLLLMTEGAAIEAVSGGQQQVAGAAGAITIDASDVTLQSGARIDTSSFSTADAGSVVIAGDALNIDGMESGLLSETLGAGHGGSVEVKTDTIQISNGGNLTVTTSGGGNAGQVVVQAQSLELTDGGNIAAQTLSSGLGGSVNVTAAEQMTFSGVQAGTDIASGISASTTGSGNAGTINLDAPTITLSDGATVKAFSGGQAQVAGAAGQISIQSDQLALSTGARVDVSSFSTADAGSIKVTTTNLSLQGHSAIASETLGAGNGGSIEIAAVLMSATEGGSLAVSSLGAGDAGEIRVQVDTLDLQSGSSIVGQTLASGLGGNIAIQVANGMSLAGTNAEATDTRISVSTTGSGHAGDIQVTTPALLMTQGARIEAVSGGQQQVAGAAGSISLETQQLEILSGASIDTSSFSIASAGSIHLVTVDMLLENTGSQVSSRTLGAGQGGSITIAAESVLLSQGTQLLADTSASGDAGSISLQADTLELTGGTIEAGTSASGAGGVIEIAVNQLQITDAGLINSGTRGTGDAGSVSVAISGPLTMSGNDSSISSRSGFGATGTFGNGGSIQVSANRVDMSEGAAIEATSSGSGLAGDVLLSSATHFNLLGGAALLTDAINSGGGNINVNAVDQIILNNSIITASAGGKNASDDSGNVTIDPIFLILKNSSILAQANYGDGGAIFLTANNFIRDVYSIIDATSQRGNDGEIIIASPDTNITGVLGVLDTSFMTEKTLLSEPCAARAFADKSSLVVIPKRLSSQAQTGNEGADGIKLGGRSSCIRP